MKNIAQPMRQIAPTTRTRLLALLGVGAAADLVAVAATGAFRFDIFSALVALVSAGSAVASFPVVRHWLLEDSETPETPTKNHSLGRTKKILILAMCAGAIAYVGGRGTFAVFTAETTNSNSGVTSGTLVLGNSNNTTGTTCYSYSGTVVYNAYGSCQPLWNTTNNMSPGQTAQSKLTVENQGSLDASTFYLSAPWPRTTLAAQANPGSPATIVITASNGFNPTLAPGNVLQLSYGSFVETLTVGSVGATASGNTTINISSGTLVHTYPAGARVENTGANTTAANTDCFDALTTTGTVPVAGATPGTSLPFVTTTNNPLCNSLVFYIQEQKTVGATTVNYCWYGLAGGPGQCRTPTTASLSGTITTLGTSSITFASALTGNIKANDTLTINDGTTSVTCKAAADAYIGDTTLAVTANSGSGPCATASGTIASGAAIKDTLAFASLDADTHTISNFDTLKRTTAPIQLYPLNQDNVNLRLGVQNTAATVWLNKHGDTGSQRIFYIGVYMPVASGQSQNQLEGLISTFSLNWHIEQ